MSKVFILIGTEGAGKTYATKQIIKNVHRDALRIFDVNNEYTDIYNKPFNPSIDLFVAECKKMKKAVFVFEDATSFFPTNGKDTDLIQMLTARRHTQNTFIFLFHAFQDCPKYILRKATDIIVFKTKDTPIYMEREFKDTHHYPVWERVYNTAKTSKFFSTYPPPKGTIPPSEYYRQ